MQAILFILGIIGAVWVILDIIQRKDKTQEQKLIWIVAAVLASIVTAIVYYLLEKKDKPVE